MEKRNVLYINISHFNYLTWVGSYKAQFVHDPLSSCLMGPFAKKQCFLHPNYLIALWMDDLFFFAYRFPAPRTSRSLDVSIWSIAKKVPIFPQFTYKYELAKRTCSITQHLVFNWGNYQKQRKKIWNRILVFLIFYRQFY